MRRSAPRPLATALAGAVVEATPATLLARAQAAWSTVAGASIAAESEPRSEREGVITVVCRSAVWAHELELLGPELTARLNAHLGAGSEPEPVDALRFVTGT